MCDSPKHKGFIVVHHTLFYSYFLAHYSYHSFGRTHTKNIRVSLGPGEVCEKERENLTWPLMDEMSGATVSHITEWRGKRG